jgi:hypothetical protein
MFRMLLALHGGIDADKQPASRRWFLKANGPAGMRDMTVFGRLQPRLRWQQTSHCVIPQN